MANTKAKKLKDRVLSFADMVELQDSLNTMTRSGWRNIGGKSQLTEYHFLTQMIVESVEMIDDSGIEHAWWKPVKDDKFNPYNVKIEIVDMLHFYIAAFIIMKTKQYNNKFKIDDDLKEMFFGCDATSIFNEEFDLESFDKLLDGNKLVHQSYVHALLSLIQLPEIASTAPPGMLNRYTYGLMNGFITMARINADELSALYRAKNELNRIRQSQGYKEGKYTKVVDGIEDNERMKSIVEEFLANKDLTLSWVAKSVRQKFFVSNV